MSAQDGQSGDLLFRLREEFAAVKKEFETTSSEPRRDELRREIGIFERVLPVLERMDRVMTVVGKAHDE